MLKEKLETKKCFSTAWGRLITDEEAYRQLNRQIDRYDCPNLFSGHAHFLNLTGKNAPQPSAILPI